MWNMLRWGRGLQMLRLGKRSANFEPVGFGRWGRSIDGQDNNRLSSSDIQSLLDSFFDESREESRRQPPLPRYGRDNIGSRFLVDVNSNDLSAHPFEMFPMSNPRSFFRPAPRGGRYKRSFVTGKYTFGDNVSQDDINRARSVVCPSIEHLMQELASLQSKEVPRPTAGRIQNVDSDDSSQAQSA